MKSRKIFSLALIFVLLVGATVTGVQLLDLSEKQSTTVSEDVDSTATSGYWYSYYSSFSISSSSTNYISTAGQLAYLAYMVNSGNTYSGYTFMLSADIDLSAHYWNPIGGHKATATTASTSYYFSGTFDGDGYQIIGLTTVDSTSYSYMGLFGYVSGATITNVGTDSTSTVSGASYVGGVVGYATNSTTITYCWNHGSITSCLDGPSMVDPGEAEYGEVVEADSVRVNTLFESYAGGVVGFTSYIIECCYNTGSVSVTAGDMGAAGGVAGYVYYSSSTAYVIRGCYNTGTVSYSAYYVGYLGGIVGYSNFSIYDCYNEGTLTAQCGAVGGILGGSPAYTDVENSYNTGSLSSADNVGGIVGSSGNAGTIIDCYNTGTLTSSSGSCGGIALGLYYMNVYNCYNIGSLTAASYAGGIATYCSSGSTIYNCYNTGSVTSTSYIVGGVIAYLYYGTVYNCYNMGAVQGTYYVGGIVGQVGYSSSYKGYVYNCFNVGSVTATSTASAYYPYVGGVVGYLYYGTVFCCYYGNGTIKGNSTAYTQGVGNTSNTDTDGETAYISNITTCAKDVGWFGMMGGSVESATWNSSYEWNFYTLWDISSDVNDGYPYLNSRNIIDNDNIPFWINLVDESEIAWEGEGTEESPYLISNEIELAYLTYMVFNYGNTSAGRYSGVYFKQTCDLDLSDYYWTPIGGHYSGGTSTSYYFMGNYDGGNFTISNISTLKYENSQKCSYMALFGSIYEATVVNLTIEDSSIEGYEYAAAIAAYAKYSTISNCKNYSEISGRWDVGGIAGELYSSVVFGCVNEGTVSTGYFLGGIAGYVTNSSEIYNCSNNVAIKGSYDIGGIVGYISASSIYKCYNLGSVTGSSYGVGGIVGYTTSSTLVHDCYNRGTVTGSSYNVGGVVGYVDSGSVYNCYNTAAVTGTYYVGGLIGRLGYSSSNLGYIYSSFNLGAVTGTSSTNSAYVGGVVGYLYYGDVSYCYYSEATILGYETTYQKGVGYVYLDSAEGSDASGVTMCIDGLSGYVKAETWFTYSGNWDSTYLWDFEDTWAIISAQNDSYPIITQKYTITFSSNLSLYGLEEAEVATISATVGSEFTTLGSTTFEMEGYTLIGWSTSSTTTVVVFEDEGVSFTGTDDTYWACDTEYVFNCSGDVTLYAVWRRNFSLTYDEAGGYWYFEDGYMPQSVYKDGATAPEGVSAEDYYNAYTINISTTDWAEVKLFEVDGDQFAYVTYYTKSGGSGASAWFNVEPIRWVVAYDETGENEPEEYSSAVSLYVVSFGQMASSGGVGFSTRQGTVQQSLQAIELATEFEYIPVSSWDFDMFVSSSTKSCVKDDAVSASSVLAVASVEEIDALGVSYATECTDFVAFLASGGTSVSGGSFVDYWTRDLAYTADDVANYGADSYSCSLNNGVYVTEDGTLFNARLSNSMGARLSISL